MKHSVFPLLLFQLVVGLHAVEYELSSNEFVDVEVVFPKQNNRNNEDAVKSNTNTFVNFLDRLLNRGDASGGAGGNVANVVAATTRRNSLLGSLVFVPDVSKGVDTILGGVATGNLEQIISGSFIFAPPRVQNVANNVINRVFGGQSIASIGNAGNKNQTGINQQPGNSKTVVDSNNLVEAVKNIQASQITTWPPVTVTPAPDIDIRLPGVNNSTTPGGFFSNIFGGLYSKSSEGGRKPEVNAGPAPSA